MIAKNKAKTGFTVIELSLSMVFISFLLIAVVVLTILMTDIYTKGNTIKNVTSVGRSLTSDFKKVIGASPAPAGLRQYYRPGESGYSASNPMALRSDRIVFLVQESKTVSGVKKYQSGRFCTGSYSYLWNTGYQIKQYEESSATAGNVIKYDGKAVRLLKISDSGREYCSDAKKSKFDLRSSAGADPDPGGIDLIGSTEANLAIYQFSANVTADDSAGGQALYAISFVLGTMSNTAKGSGDGSIDSAMTCTPPGGDKSEFNYCAINKFDIVVRATGNKSG
ncbi:MAG: hypothetical protein LBL84_01805 [Candidatus Nomurabacteria bacterium]|jgi:hypothetical protein|nr:hypothetical protein [Candidatus Nomurabacteria bacterium]